MVDILFLFPAGQILALYEYWDWLISLVFLPFSCPSAFSIQVKSRKYITQYFIMGWLLCG